MAIPICLIGSSNTDLVVKAEKLPMPGETVIGGTFLMNPGGKGANQAVTASRLGSQVYGLAIVRWRALGSGDPAHRFSKFDLAFRARLGQSAVARVPAVAGTCLNLRDGTPMAKNALVDAINSKRGDDEEPGRFMCRISLALPPNANLGGGVTLATAINYGFNVRKLDEATGRPFDREVTAINLR